MSDNVCQDEVCITCSDQLLEVVVTAVSADGGTAQAACDGVACEVSIDLLDGVGAGDHLLVHGGVALQHGTLRVAP
ncbi:MAG TPA: HypC/HybG/HupF family hydrogenase formation chaperone [Candidatus Dormibacteraeota bacterium]|jgi:hydrogenase maturation factor|nr:HypC/HybG/HupF family hydrogenase formation chaperone [Candidatus Dormibacteraeota bacterium]